MVWAALIALVALAVERREEDDETGPEPTGREAAKSPEGRPMLSGPVIITVALLYLCLLFAIAYYGDKRADQGRSLIANPTIYALSIAVYCTSWTFYGSVGRAASTGVDFLPIYLGPTLTFILAWFVIRKIIRISKVNRTTSIADFIASRYGKSFQLGALVTIIAVVGDPSLHFAAAQSDLDQFFGAAAISRDRDAEHFDEHAFPAGHRALRCPDHGAVRDPVRNAAYRCERAA